MNTIRTFTTGSGAEGKFHSLPALADQGYPNLHRLPISIRIILESLLRNNDGLKVSDKDIANLASYNAKAPGDFEIPFVVARIVLQDFTGVPLLVDLAAMRSAVDRMGLDAKMIEPLVPVDLVVDHSVQVDYAGTKDSLERNLDLEFHRNRERYEFLKWGEQAFDTFKVVPPGIGIVHQVNLEYLAKCVLEKNGVFYPDTLVGTDSHTTMINGLGVVGWGVGGVVKRSQQGHWKLRPPVGLLFLQFRPRLGQVVSLEHHGAAAFRVLNGGYRVLQRRFQSFTGQVRRLAETLLNNGGNRCHEKSDVGRFCQSVRAPSNELIISEVPLADTKTLINLFCQLVQRIKRCVGIHV